MIILILLFVLFSDVSMDKKARNRIKAVLAEKGISNNWLAKTLDKNRTTVSKWCTNQMQPTVETLFEIAEVLEVDVRELLVGREAVR